MVRWVPLCFLLIGCTGMPGKTELLEGVEAPRTHYNLEVTYVPSTDTDWACRQRFKEHKVRGVWLPPVLFHYRACAIVPFDHDLGPGETPWCEIILPEGAGPGTNLYEHEIAHCEGWAH